MRRGVAGLILLGLLVASPGFAQRSRATMPEAEPDVSSTNGARETTPDPRLPMTLPLSDNELEGAIDPNTYMLGPGDVVVLGVLGRITLDVPLEVDPEGRIWIPDLGPMTVAGRTLTSARQELSRKFRGGTRGVEVHLRLERLRRFKVYVHGEVGHPGAYEATAVTRVSEVVRRAGGLGERASKRNIRVSSATDSARTADLLRFERLGDLAANPTLSDGSIVTVPPAERSVIVHAPVPYPGDYEFRQGDKLSDILALVGPFHPEAQLQAAAMLRFQGDADLDTLHIDLPAVIAGRTDLALMEGDRLFVPALSDYHLDRNVTVAGEVLLPGTYPLRRGFDRVSNMIALAGGISPEGNPRSVLVIRQAESPQDRDPEFERLSRLSRSEMTDNEYQTFRTKLASARAFHLIDMEIIGSGETGQRADAVEQRDVLLEPGDVIRVERTSHSIQVAGEVRWPGLLKYDSQLSGKDYVRIAGGYTGRANSGGVRLTRAASGQTILLRDAGRIEPGDLIFVPEKRDVNLWGVLRDIIIVAGSVATVIIAFR